MTTLIRRRARHALVAAALCGALVAPGAKTAAAELIEDTQTWLNATAVGHLGAQSTPWRYWLDVQARFDDDSSRFGVGILRPGLGYALSARTTVWAGYGHIVTDTIGPGGNVIEHRAWQQLSWSAPQPVAGTQISSRTRFEQRAHENGSEIGWRLRQLYKLVHPLATGSPWSLVAIDEVFVNFNGTGWGAADGFDQNRAFAGIGLALNAHARAEVGYLNQYVAREEAADRMVHAASLNLLLNF